MGNKIIFRLRKDKDDDIKKALEKAAEKTDKSHVIRTALRQYLFGQSKQQIVEDITDIDIKLEQKVKTEEQLNSSLDDLLKF